MEPQFWLERWQENQIGFHQSVINPLLTDYWSNLRVSPGSQVLVPLCGKSQDLSWLAEQGHSVIGIELSDIAVADFFKQCGSAPSQQAAGSGVHYSDEQVSIWCGDYFHYPTATAQLADQVFDRASLIALPADRRQAYVDKLLTLITPNAQILLITLEYKQASMAGPPFAVLPDEVETLYGQQFDIEQLGHFPLDMEEEGQRFAQKGVEQMAERLWLLSRRA